MACVRFSEIRGFCFRCYYALLLCLFACALAAADGEADPGTGMCGGVQVVDAFHVLGGCVVEPCGAV